MAQNENSEMNYSEICQKAVKIAKDQGVTFDFSPESITELDKLFMGQVKRYRSGKTTEVYLWNLSVIFGVYLGQTMLFNGLGEKGYKWVVDKEKIPLLSDGGENYVSPLRHLFMYAKGQQDINARTLFESVLDLAFGDTSRAVRNIPM